MNNKIGIITLYHNSQNYGGLLQAYAMTRYLNDMGYLAEQIDFDNARNDFMTFLKRKIKRIKSVDKLDGIDLEISQCLKTRRKCLKRYRENIPHSDKVYNYKNIKTSNKIYDVFICGSDQIWNYKRSDVYFLNFVNKEKIKFSYSAGMSNVLLNRKEKKWINKVLEKMDGISVREKESIDILCEKKKEILVTVDPTLLLKKEEWRAIEKKPDNKVKYMLCYFLSPNESVRRMAQKYAKTNNLEVINVPFLNKDNIDIDRKFGDVRLIELDPFELLGYIDDAEIIVTDSFHVTLFSCLFDKNVHTFSRPEHPEMSARITNLLYLFGRKEDLIRTGIGEEQGMELLKVKSQNGNLQELEENKLVSKQYIQKMLEIK